MLFSPGSPKRAYAEPVSPEADAFMKTERGSAVVERVPLAIVEQPAAELEPAVEPAPPTAAVTVPERPAARSSSPAETTTATVVPLTFTKPQARIALVRLSVDVAAEALEHVRRDAFEGKVTVREIMTHHLARAGYCNALPTSPFPRPADRASGTPSTASGATARLSVDVPAVALERMRRDAFKHRTTIREIIGRLLERAGYVSVAS